MNPKFLICQFRPGERGPFCDQPIGHFARFGRVIPHRHNRTEVAIGVKYFCRVVHAAGRSTFVMVEKPCSEFLKEFLPALTVASWKRGQHITSDIATEVEVEGYGTVKAEWYESTGKYKHTYLSLKFPREEEEIRFTLDEHEAPVEIDAVRKRIRATVGPAVALAAVISRQADARPARYAGQRRY